MTIKKATLIDTCGWIEWLTDGSLSEEYKPYFSHIETIIVPTSVQYELYKWVTRQASLQQALEAIAITEQARIITLTTSISLSAADISTQYQLSFADAIIYATAQFYQAELITSDSHFKNLQGVKYFKKS